MKRPQRPRNKVSVGQKTNYPPLWNQYQEMAAMSYHFKMSWKDILDMPLDMYNAYVHWLVDNLYSKEAE